MDDLPQHNTPDGQQRDGVTLNYASPRGSAFERVRPPNPMAQRSFWCGMALFLVFLLAVMGGPAAGGSLGMVLMILIYLSWPVLSVLAIVFGIIGYRRARHSGLDGAGEAGLGLGTGVVGVVITLLMIVVIMGLNRQYAPDGPAYRVKCASTLRSIGQACDLYAREHGGQYPLRIEQLYTDCGFAPEQFICPTTEDTPASGNTPEEIVAALAQPGHCSYVYVGGGLRIGVPGNTVLVYEKLENHEKRGMHVLYEDGQIVWLDAKAAGKFMGSLGTKISSPATAPAR